MVTNTIDGFDAESTSSPSSIAVSGSPHESLDRLQPTIVDLLEEMPGGPWCSFAELQGTGRSIDASPAATKALGCTQTSTAATNSGGAGIQPLGANEPNGFCQILH